MNARPMLLLTLATLVGISTVAYCDIIDDSLPVIECDVVDTPLIQYTDLPKLADVSEEIDITDDVEFDQEVNHAFQDKRLLEEDKSITLNNPIIEKWLEIYKNHTNRVFEYVALEKSKVIAEAYARDIQSYKILDENVSFYQSRGYDTVLVTFDAHSEIHEVLNLVAHVRSLRMRVWLAYGGEFEDKQSLYMDPDKYSKILQQAAPMCSAYLLAWRKSSGHIWMQDREYIDYTIEQVRSTNPNIAIIGEIYYGNNTLSQDENSIMTIDATNVSGMVLQNMDNESMSKKYVVSKYRSKYANASMIGGVVGDRAMYLYNNTYPNTTYVDHFEMKKRIEREFIRYGCGSTLTLSDDGSSRDTCNIAKTKYTQL